MTHPFACDHCRLVARLEAAHARGVRRWYHPGERLLVEVVAIASTPAGPMPVVRELQDPEAVAIVMRGLLSDWMPLEVV